MPKNKQALHVQSNFFHQIQDYCPLCTKSFKNLQLHLFKTHHLDITKQSLKDYLIQTNHPSSTKLIHFNSRE